MAGGRREDWLKYTAVLPFKDSLGGILEGVALRVLMQILVTMNKVVNNRLDIFFIYSAVIDMI